MRTIRLVWLAVMMALVGCGNDPGGPSAPAVAPLLSIIAGDVQTDTVMRQLPVQVAARLTDKLSGVPLAGRVVNWVVIEGGGTIFAAVTQTGSDGVARQPYTLGPIAGRQRLVARWLDPETGEPITLDTASAFAVPGRAAAAFIAPTSDTARGVVGARMTLSIEYGYTDAWGNRTWSGCADPDSVGWTWDTGDIIANTRGFIYTTNPNVTWYLLEPMPDGARRSAWFYFANSAATVRFQAYNTCLKTVAAATVVLLAQQ